LSFLLSVEQHWITGIKKPAEAGFFVVL
jgi:hypothetical protein